MRRLRLGVAGLGRAFTLMLPTLAGDPRLELAAAADPRPEARRRFAVEFNARSYASVEELTEAIALGHDLGHTPFGHAGERVINDLIPGGFNHYEQSLRIVDVLEHDGQGLNLSWEVRDGIAHHSKGKGGSPVGMPPSQRSKTLEGQIVRVADLTAYVNHDIDDAQRAGILRAEDGIVENYYISIEVS